MKTITIAKTDFNILNLNSIKKFNTKLREINEPFEVIFNFSIGFIPNIFERTRISKITIPATTNNISSFAFENCIFLENIVFKNEIESIGDFAFKNCTNLENVTISAKKINNFIFSNCTNLKNVSFSENLARISANIFENCPSLEKISILFSKEHFLSNVKGAQNFLEKYENIIIFDNIPSLDYLIQNNKSIENIIQSISKSEQTI